jgi:ethanolamine utilization microcompartment shell protein EutL
MRYAWRMFGPGIGTIFASRWKALWWSAGVLLTAYCTVPSADETKESKEITAGQSQEVKAAKEAVDVIQHLNDAPSQD